MRTLQLRFDPRVLGRALCVTVFGLGAMVIVGWALHIPALTALAPGMVSMKPNTAFGLRTLAAGIPTLG